MIIEKRITVTIPVPDPIEYCSNSNNAMIILKRLYEGKCYAQCLIIEILKIINEGECMLVFPNTSTEGVVNIVMLVKAIEYTSGETINGCKIISKEESTSSFTCETDYAKMMVAYPAEMMNALLPDHMISVVVNVVRYHLYAPKISVTGFAFTINQSISIYKLVPFSPKSELYKNIFAAIDQEEKIATDLQKGKGWSTFNQLLYAYSKPQPIPSDTTTVNILTLAKQGSIAQIYLCKHPVLDQAKPEVLKCKNATDIPNASVFEDLPSDAVMLHLLMRYYDRLVMLREMLEIYVQDPEISVKHSILWKILAKQKKIMQ